MAALAQPPVPVSTGSDIPTYYQVPETAYDRMFLAFPLIIQCPMRHLSNIYPANSGLGRPRHFGSISI